MWEIRRNVRVRKSFEAATITEFVKTQILRWLGYIERIKENRMVKRKLNLQPIEMRSHEQLKTRWLQAAIADLKEKGIRKWKARPRNREE